MRASVDSEPKITRSGASASIALASVFEVARAPGKNVVYLGCALLIIGIFAMLYVRDRRLWVWLAPGSGGAQATMALSANRKTLDTDREFAQLRTQLLGTDETLPHGGKT